MRFGVNDSSLVLEVVTKIFYIFVQYMACQPQATTQNRYTIMSIKCW